MVSFRQDRPTAVARNGPLRGTPPLPPTLLAAALANAAFVGELYKERIIPHALVANCLKMLSMNMTVIEELRAIQTILEHCDASLYSGPSMDAFINMVANKAMASIRDNASAVGERFGRKELQELIKVGLIDLTNAVALRDR